MYLAPPRLGQPSPPLELRLGPAHLVWTLPHLRCTVAQRAEVTRVMGRTVSAAEVRAAILKAGEQATDLAVQAWFKLEDAKLPADVEQLFMAAFGVASTARSVAPGTTMRRIVIARYEGAIRRLNDDDVHVSCWGWPWGGIREDRPETYFTNNVPKRHGIALGKHFWAAVRDGDATSPAAALLGTALNLFYYRMKFSAPTPRTVRAACYVRFAILAAGLSVPAWAESQCAAN